MTIAGTITTAVVRILIVDDHPLVRQGFLDVFEFVPDIDAIGSAATAEEALQAIDQLQPDVVLLDLTLPGTDGVTATALIKEQSPDRTVLIFTGVNSPAMVRRALDAGADGVVLKTAPISTLIDAIHAAGRGEAVIDPDVAAMAARGHDPLSERELEVLRLMATGKSNKHIAVELFIASTTAKTHVERIIKKLDATDRTGAVAEALRRGLIR